MKAYYQLSGEEVLREVNGSEEPLTKEQVSENQKKYGPNELTEGKKKTTFQIFLEQYKDFLVIILIIAAIASGFMGDIESAAVIVIVITMNAILGTVQTVKAEASLASLKKLSGPEAKVLRDGVVVPIPSSEVTVGDIIMLEAGDYIPADGRILECASMKVDESALTGESLGVEKTTDVIEQDEVPLGDRINMVYSGSFLTYGRGSFVVTEIGMNTEVGKIASLLKTTSEKKTPLQVNLDQFGQKLSILILVFCAILFGISVFRGENIGNAFLFAVALAVAAIPEAVWMIGTIKDKGPDTAGKWSVMDLPKVDGGEYSVSNGGSDLAINAKTDYPDEAKDFVKFAMTDTKLQASGFEKYGLYPSYIPSYEEEIFQKGDSFFGDTNIYEIFIENGKNVAEIPISPNAQEAGDSIGAAVSKIFLNGADVKSTMKDLEDELTTKFK